MSSPCPRCGYCPACGRSAYVPFWSWNTSGASPIYVGGATNTATSGGANATYVVMPPATECDHGEDGPM